MPLIFGLFNLFIACNPFHQEGGECFYDRYEGTCEIVDDLSATFTGEIDGEVVTLSVELYDDYEAGESIACTLSYITEGTCSPCMLDIGDCGDDAWDYLESIH